MECEFTGFTNTMLRIQNDNVKMCNVQHIQRHKHNIFAFLLPLHLSIHAKCLLLKIVVRFRYFFCNITVWKYQDLKGNVYVHTLWTTKHVARGRTNNSNCSSKGKKSLEIHKGKSKSHFFCRILHAFYKTLRFCTCKKTRTNTSPYPASWQVLFRMLFWGSGYRSINEHLHVSRRDDSSLGYKIHHLWTFFEHHEISDM